MYSIVMLAAMTAAPEAPDFCCKGGGCCAKTSCYGCNGGCAGCYGGGYPYSTYPAPIVVPPPPETAPPPKKDEPKKKDPAKVGSLSSDKAQVVVTLPPDARLIADGQLTDGAGAERVFLTPTLPVGKDFHYTLKIEYRDGEETKTTATKLTVRAGHRSEVDFNVHSTSAVSVNLPENAKLFVDGTQTATTGGKLSFVTPELPRGQIFTYQFRAEIDRGGKTETVNREVKFKAGEPVVVNFNAPAVISTASK